MLDGRPELERGRLQSELLVDLGGQRLRVLGGEVSADPAVEDAVLFGRGEVHSVRQVAVGERHPGADRLEDATSRMLLTRVVAEDGEDGDVGLGGDPLPHGVDEPLAPPRGKRVEERRCSSFERRPALEDWKRIVRKPIEAHIEELVHHAAFTMSANSSGSRLAPPTSAPSISGWAVNSRMLPALTLPPYWTRTDSATSVENMVSMVSRMRRITSPASAAVAARPVP